MSHTVNKLLAFRPVAQVVLERVLPPGIGPAERDGGLVNRRGGISVISHDVIDASAISSPSESWAEPMALLEELAEIARMLAKPSRESETRRSGVGVKASL